MRGQRKLAGVGGVELSGKLATVHGAPGRAGHPENSSRQGWHCVGAMVGHFAEGMKVIFSGCLL